MSMHLAALAKPHRDVTSLLEIKGLKKSYGLKPILRSINLSVAPGERIALLGANGAGKTTLLRILAGLTKIDAGTVCIEGYDSGCDVQQVRRLIGFVGHQPYLYEELTALENLLFFGRMYAVDHVRERAYQLLQRVGLERRMHEYVKTFSHGQSQRLALARALLHQPELLLLDEPDTGLDQQGNALIASLLTEHSERGGATLFSTHHLEYALDFSERIVILNAGRIASLHETAQVDLPLLRESYQEVVR